MSNAFPDALKVTLAWEGGWSNDPQDPGGATMRGVTQAVYDGWRKRRGLPTQTVRAIADAELVDIYRAQYWSAVRAPELPGGVDLAVFDFAVNSGPRRAALALQAVLGVKMDGEIGEATLAAARAAAAEGLVDALCDRRMAFLRGLRHWPRFGKGWTARVAAVRRAALALARQSAPPPIIGRPPLPPTPVPSPVADEPPAPKATPEPAADKPLDKAIAIGTAGSGFIAAIAGAVSNPYALGALALLVLVAGLAAWRLWPRATMPELQA